MLEKPPVANFDQLLGDFNQTIAAQSVSKAEQRRLEHDARNKWEELSAARDRMLDSILEERGLAECSWTDHEPEVWIRSYRDNFGRHSDKINMEELKKFKPEDLGIYPKGQMRLHFTRHTINWGADPFMRERYQIDSLELLCPQHFPTETNKSLPSRAEKHNRQGDFDIESEVVNKDGKLITLVGAVDVTHVEVGKHRPELIYRYFDLPSLPPEPKQ